MTIEFRQDALDRLLHDPTGPTGVWLREKAEEVRDACQKEAENVSHRQGVEFMLPVDVRIAGLELEAEITADNEPTLRRNMAGKAKREGASGWMGRGVKTVFVDVR